MLRRIVACRCGSVNPSVRGGLSVRLIYEQLLRLRQTLSAVSQFEKAELVGRVDQAGRGVGTRNKASGGEPGSARHDRLISKNRPTSSYLEVMSV